MDSCRLHLYERVPKMRAKGISDKVLFEFSVLINHTLRRICHSSFEIHLPVEEIVILFAQVDLDTVFMGLIF